jgi:hypothetical protein
VAACGSPKGADRSTGKDSRRSGSVTVFLVLLRSKNLLPARSCKWLRSNGLGGVDSCCATKALTAYDYEKTE